MGFISLSLPKGFNCYPELAEALQLHLHVPKRFDYHPEFTEGLHQNIYHA
jgi:hypothetical protein